jgi:hypothetical protein
MAEGIGISGEKMGCFFNYPTQAVTHDKGNGLYINLTAGERQR